MTAFLAFSEANSYKNSTNISDNLLFCQGNPLNLKDTFAPIAPPGKGQRGRLPPPVPACLIVSYISSYKKCTIKYKLGDHMCELATEYRTMFI